jgi:hypothetical protein
MRYHLGRLEKNRIGKTGEAEVGCAIVIKENNTWANPIVWGRSTETELIRFYRFVSTVIRGKSLIRLQVVVTNLIAVIFRTLREYIQQIGPCLNCQLKQCVQFRMTFIHN